MYSHTCGRCLPSGGSGRLPRHRRSSWPRSRAARSFGAFGRPLAPPASQAQVKGRLHSLARDREAIGHHYDLSNDFYQLILDEKHGVLPRAIGLPMHRTTRSKTHRQTSWTWCAARSVSIEREACGFSMSAVVGARSACMQRGSTAPGLSESRSRRSRRHLSTRRSARSVWKTGSRFALQDYREIPDGPSMRSRPSRWVSNVGEDNYPTYVKALHDNVIAGGRVLIQQMSRTGPHPGGGPFIESFIAPDMYMRPVGRTVAMIEEGGLEVRDVHALREHYVRTVDAWIETFESNWDRVVDLVGVEVARVWRLYLVGGGMAFRDGRMGVDQILSVRPHGDGRSGMETGTAAVGVAAMNGFDWGAFGVVTLTSLLAIAVGMAVTATIGVRIGRHKRCRRVVGRRLRSDRARVRDSGNRRPLAPVADACTRGDLGSAVGDAHGDSIAWQR